MDTKSLVQNLDKFCSELDDKYDINSGGCCLLSYLISKHLDKLNIPYRLCLFHKYGNINNDVIRYHIKNKIKSVPFGVFTCNHYTLEIDGIIINRLYKSREISNYINWINSDDIKYIYKHGHWNTDYDKQLNKVISRLVNNFFKKYE